MGTVWPDRTNCEHCPPSALRLPDSKTGAKVVHIGGAVIDVLEKIERIDKNPQVP